VTLQKRIEKLELDATQFKTQTIPETAEGVIAYLKQSGYSFAVLLAEMLNSRRDDYTLTICRGLLQSPDPEATIQAMNKVYGNVAN
jgi:hypothetical protein